MAEIRNIEDWIEKLKDSGFVIIVEGANDKKALEHFGIKTIVTLRKRPMYAIAEKIMHEENDAIILTDLDKEGKELYGKMKKELSRNGVKVNNSFRNYLFRETKLRQIEGLVSYYNKNSVSEKKTKSHGL